jgi:NAD(P)-dependent dehydrogenase (short-subunit alcohol dehydrogenase family)
MTNTKWVLITGCSRGIGAETALMFANQGYNIIGTYREQEDQANRVLAECIGSPEVHAIRLDLTENDSIAQAVHQVKRILGDRHLDVFVSNAGRLISAPPGEMSKADRTEIMWTNFWGPKGLTLRLLQSYPSMTMVFVGTDLGLIKHDETCEDYTESKDQLRKFVARLGLDGYRAFCVNPDKTQTGMTGFEGRPPHVAARIIYETSAHGYGKLPGSSINVWTLA